MNIPLRRLLDLSPIYGVHQRLCGSTMNPLKLAITCLFVKLVQGSGDRLLADRLIRIDVTIYLLRQVFNDIVAFHTFSSISLRITGIASAWRLGRPVRRLPTTEAPCLRRFLNSDRAHFSTSRFENAKETLPRFGPNCVTNLP